MQPLAFARPIEAQRQRNIAKAAQNEPPDLVLALNGAYLPHIESYEVRLLSIPQINGFVSDHGPRN